MSVLGLFPLELALVPTERVPLHVFPHNLPALALYEQCGYEREGYRRRHYRRPAGSFVDAVLMAKSVA